VLAERFSHPPEVQQSNKTLHADRHSAVLGDVVGDGVLSCCQPLS